MGEPNDNAVRDRIKAKLQAALDPTAIEVIDESRKHASHAQAMARPGAITKTEGTHFHVKIVSEAFKDKSRIERHRAVNQLLKADFDAGVHALAIEAKTPDE